MKIFRYLIRLNLLLFFVLLVIELSGATCVADDAKPVFSSAQQEQGIERLSTADDADGALSVVKAPCQCPCHGSFFHNHQVNISPLTCILTEINHSEHHTIEDTPLSLFQPPQYLV